MFHLSLVSALTIRLKIRPKARLHWRVGGHDRGSFVVSPSCTVRLKVDFRHRAEIDNMFKSK